MRLMLILSYAYQGKIYLYARWIADEGGARARSDQTLQICRSGPTYAGVCMINNPTDPTYLKQLPRN